MNHYPRGTALAGAGLTPGAGRLPSRQSAAALFSLFLVALLFAVGSAEAATINAKSGKLREVAEAVSAAADGDTVYIPPGTATWSSPLNVTKAITLQGSGSGSTVIKDNVQTGPLLTWTLVAGKAARMTGIEFQNGGRTNTAYAPGGLIHVSGSNTDGSSFRWDHCNWTNLNGYPVFDTVIGVIDHNNITYAGIWIYVYGNSWNGNNWGDGSWAAPANWGSSQFLFIEDNTFTNASGTYLGAVTDSLSGGRFVVRNNNIFNGSIQNHGSESGQRFRGGRAVEIYNNIFTGTNLSNLLTDIRSGGCLFHDNTVSGYSVGLGPRLFCNNHRSFNSFSPWGAADGTNTIDVNRAGGPFYSGAALRASSGLTVTVSGSPGWLANQWAGYAVKRTTNLGNAAGPGFGTIMSNTSNTITYTDGGGYAGGNLSFANGDSLQIWKVDQAFDQPGRAGGTLVHDTSRGSGVPVFPSLNDQITDPMYSWGNKNPDTTPLTINFSPAVAAIRSNEHYFNSTVKPDYTPYTYPHPLVTGGAVASPPAPANLRVISAP